jgi:hypothetical protein
VALSCIRGSSGAQSTHGSLQRTWLRESRGDGRSRLPQTQTAGDDDQLLGAAATEAGGTIPMSFEYFDLY